VSAEVETVYLYTASCGECLTAFEPHEDEHLAYEWAANHDAENHAVDSGEDEKYERFKEWRDEE
jgi:coproporphyrinogen III oxidase